MRKRKGIFKIVLERIRAFIDYPPKRTGRGSKSRPGEKNVDEEEITDRTEYTNRCIF